MEKNFKDATNEMIDKVELLRKAANALIEKFVPDDGDASNLKTKGLITLAEGYFVDMENYCRLSAEMLQETHDASVKAEERLEKIEHMLQKANK